MASVDVLIEGGKATAAPPLGPALGPLGVNIGQVVAEINNKTQDFKGMQVPVKVEVDEETKEFKISIGTPPASALIKQEAGVQKGSGKAKDEMVADLRMEQVMKIAKMKEDATLGADPKAKVKEIVGTCVSMGIMVEGKDARETLKEISAGKYDEKIASGKTELSAEEMKELEEERKKMQEELAEKHEKMEAEANAILAKFEGKETNVKRKALAEAEIDQVIIDKLAPEEKKEEGS